MVSQIFFKGYPATQFQVLNIPGDQSTTQLYIGASGGLLNITHHHCIVCMEPLTIAVVYPGLSTNVKSLVIHQNERNKITLTIRHSQSIKIDENDIQLFEIIEATFKLPATAKLLILKLITHSKISRELFKKLAALYTIPREVVLISFLSKAHFNIFPMDFAGYFPSSKIYLFGLRTSNITIEHIIAEKKLVVSTFNCNNKEVIYQLGKHHSTEPPRLETLPFSTFETETFRFPVPGFATGYKEISLLAHINIGTHTLLIGTPVFETTMSAARRFCHIDTIEFLSHSRQYSPFLLR